IIRKNNAVQGYWGATNCQIGLPYVCESPVITCGDGHLDAGEQCDQGNSNVLLGPCDENCHTGSGYFCRPGAQGVSVCTALCPNAGNTGSGTIVQASAQRVTIQCGTPADWASARTQCQSIGANWDLVDITSRSQNDVLASFVGERAWFGAN